jgi:hypothetical protein
MQAHKKCKGPFETGIRDVDNRRVALHARTHARMHACMHAVKEAETQQETGTDVSS